MKKFSSITFSLLAVILFITTHAISGEKDFPSIISMGTGSTGGAYNMVGVTVAKYWGKDLNVKAKVMPGLNLSNIVRFGKGRMDSMVSSSSWQKAAWNAREDIGFPEPIQNFRALCYIYDDIWFFVTTTNSSINEVADFKGKRVGCGAKASVFDKMIGNRIEANGIKYFGENPDFTKVYSSYSDQARLLKDGKLDALLGLVSGDVPQPSIRQLMEEAELKPVRFNQQAINYKDELFPAWEIDKEWLPFLKKNYWGIQTGRASMVIREDFSDEFAYALTKTIHKNLEKMGKENPYWGFATRHPEYLTWNSGIPYHPGAVKYWKEAGLWKR